MWGRSKISPKSLYATTFALAIRRYLEYPASRHFFDWVGVTEDRILKVGDTISAHSSRTSINNMGFQEGVIDTLALGTWLRD